MQRTLRVKRIYSMGQYQNIEIADEITEIPDRLALNDTFIDLVTKQQLLKIEKKFNQYLLIRENHRDLTPQEAIALIEDELAEERAKLSEYLKGE